MRLVKHEIRKSIIPIKDSTTYAHLYDYTIEQITKDLKWHIEILALFDHFVINRILTKSLKTKS